MRFSYDPTLARDFPALRTGLVAVAGLPAGFDAGADATDHEARALRRLEEGAEAEFPEIRAWRAAFARMGLKPTKHRCAAEALLRRLRREGTLSRLHPLVDLCNAVSAAHALPVAAFDLARVGGDLLVRPADGTERYAAFDGTEEHPEAGEVIFADDAGTAHARRWTNRQSAASAVSAATREALLVIEGLHATAETDVAAARDALARPLVVAGVRVRTGHLVGGRDAFEAGP